MALSEREQQLLAQLEQQLHAEDPQFVSSMDSRPVAPSFSTRAVVLGAVVGIVGLGIVIGGVAVSSILLGLLGFLVMSFGVYWASTRGAGSSQDAESAPQKKKSAAASAKGQPSGFMRNLEDKWDERRSDGR